MFKASICRLAGPALLAGAVVLSGQAPAPTAPAPSTPAPKAAARAAAAKDPAPDEAVATINGEKITAGRLQQLRRGLPPQFQQAVSRMNNKAFLKSYAELLFLSQLAEKEKFPERDPYKDQLAFLRMNFLAQSYIAALNTKTGVTQEELQQYYEQHKGDYQEASVRAIYVAFSPAAAQQASTDPKAKKTLTEEQAKAKAEALVEQLKKGADFAKLAKENSDDTSSAEKGGDIGTLKRNSSGIPADLKKIIFELKAGEVSAPVRQPAGFYIFKVETQTTAPYDQVAANITTAVQSQKVQGEIKKLLDSIKITYDHEGFFSDNPPAPPVAAPKQDQPAPAATPKPKP